MKAFKFETFHDGIKSAHIAAFVSSYDSFKDITKQNEIGIKSVHIAAFDYEMHEYYDAFSYSNNNFALNDLILILSPIISVWHHKSNPILFNHKMGFTNLLHYNNLL